MNAKTLETTPALVPLRVAELCGWIGAGVLAAWGGAYLMFTLLTETAEDPAAPLMKHRTFLVVGMFLAPAFLVSFSRMLHRIRCGAPSLGRYLRGLEPGSRAGRGVAEPRTVWSESRWMLFVLPFHLLFIGLFAGAAVWVFA